VTKATLLRAVVDALRTREPVAVVTLLEAEGAPRVLVYADPALPTIAEGAPLPHATVEAIESEARAAIALGEHRNITLAGTGRRAFIEVQAPPPHLIICGAGHIAVPLAQVASLCDYDVTVIDDRAAFASRERFPTASAVHVGDFREELRALRNGRRHFPPRTALALVTRGHQHDVECLVEVIHDGLDYIGMIGSKRRIRAVFQLLQSEYGIPRERFERVFAPVGLDIGSRTPAEIAVAIVAEMINVARGGPAISLSRPSPPPAPRGSV
jgi:xanthine dehydrogenase accessory factor